MRWQLWTSCDMIRRRRQKCLLLLLLLLVLLFFFALFDSVPVKIKARYPVGPRQGYDPFVTIFPKGKGSAKISADEVKTILLWTGFFGSNTWLTTSETFRSCAVKSCRVTVDKREIREVDAVLMNVRDIYSPSDLPPVHPPHQVWIVHGSEPPYYVEIQLDSFNNVFNWTSWYRTDADIFSPYGHFTPVGPERDFKPDEANGNYHHKTISDQPTPGVFQPNFIEEEKGDPDLSIQLSRQGEDMDPFSLHDKLVYWAASSCINYSQRYKMVSALQRYLPVDTYGSCGRLSCPRNSESCQKLLQRYKFVLAFENGYCRDYVTEKYWNALSRNQIPIVSGGADYSRVAIPGSYIDVDNFTSVAQLASFILRVASDRRLYNSFFAWKTRFRRLGFGVCNWCQMCALLHDGGRPPQVYSDFSGWVAEDTCPVNRRVQYFWWLFHYLRFQTFGI